jgi:hypothetical protein
MNILTIIITICVVVITFLAAELYMIEDEISKPNCYMKIYSVISNGGVAVPVRIQEDCTTLKEVCETNQFFSCIWIEKSSKIPADSCYCAVVPAQLPDFLNKSFSGNATE